MKWSGSRSVVSLCDPMDYRVHGILQPRILEWAAVPFSRGSSWPRSQTGVSCIAGGFFTPTDLSGKPHTCQEPGTRIRVFFRKNGASMVQWNRAAAERTDSEGKTQNNVSKNVSTGQKGILLWKQRLTARLGAEKPIHLFVQDVSTWANFLL